MKQIQTIEDVYPAIEELIAELKLGSRSHLADILHHRMHLVAWTTASELLEELHCVLGEALQSASNSQSIGAARRNRNICPALSVATADDSPCFVPQESKETRNQLVPKLRYSRKRSGQGTRKRRAHEKYYRHETNQPKVHFLRTE